MLLELFSQLLLWKNSYPDDILPHTASNHYGQRNVWVNKMINQSVTATFLITFAVYTFHYCNYTAVVTRPPPHLQ